jgi:hypothetical protein
VSSCEADLFPTGKGQTRAVINDISAPIPAAVAAYAASSSNSRSVKEFLNLDRQGKRTKENGRSRLRSRRASRH